MKKDRRNGKGATGSGKGADSRWAGVNPDYPADQLVRALEAAEGHEDPETRSRAERKVGQWIGVLDGILTGTLDHGSRVPVAGAPLWATPEVVKGGFATGALRAGGPLLEHEEELLRANPGLPKVEPRYLLNAWHLSDVGLSELQERLGNGCYEITVPEEGALMVVAWLLKKGHAEETVNLIDILAPHFSQLRFYPVPTSTPQSSGVLVHLQSVGETREKLRRLEPQKRVLAQKKAVEVWAPFYDRMVDLFLETVQDDWPCRNYPEGWSQRALALLGEYDLLLKEHSFPGKMARKGGHARQLREFLGRCAMDPESLTGKEVGRIRMILRTYLEKRGRPDSDDCAEFRRRQQQDVAGPMYADFAPVVEKRLEEFPEDGGLDAVERVAGNVTDEEAEAFDLPGDAAIPESILRRVARALHDTVDVLVERGLITSGDVIAQVLPQITASLQEKRIADRELGDLYSRLYRAFRRRRSLLLLNYESQVRFEELPWVATIEKFRTSDLSTQRIARQTLEEVVLLALNHFPWAILPNPLLREIRSLLGLAGLRAPIVDELAADIFMGDFTKKFVLAAREAADLLEGTLYERYYGIDYREVRSSHAVEQEAPAVGAAEKFLRWVGRSSRNRGESFAEICTRRAGVERGSWNPATNGMIIEQQQILTTQNLAPIVSGLDIADSLREHCDAISRSCFQWICRELQLPKPEVHGRLIAIKNAAYAWRQMLFFMALMSEEEAQNFFLWATSHLDSQDQEFRRQFEPAMNGLEHVVQGGWLQEGRGGEKPMVQFLGWSDSGHWLLTYHQKDGQPHHAEQP